MPANEASFRELAGVPVHYDRLPAPNGYGSQGKSREFACREKLKTTLEDCFEELFDVWDQGRPTIILSAGTIGDGMNAHGQGYAFDLDGFYWEDSKFMMLGYPTDRPFYIGINAHLFLYFSQVLGFHYPNHADHFHVDFNFSQKFRPESNAQTFFVQSCLRYIFDRDIGHTGSEKDGVDGVFGGTTKIALDDVLDNAGIGSITKAENWKEFLRLARRRAFAF